MEVTTWAREFPFALNCESACCNPKAVSILALLSVVAFMPPSNILRPEFHDFNVERFTLMNEHGWQKKIGVR